MALRDAPQPAARVRREAAFNRLMDGRVLDGAYRYATILLGDRAEAEDAAHDAALSAWRHFDDLRDETRFDAWFGRILVNACRDRLRARRNLPSPLDESEPALLGRPGGGDPADGVGRRELIASALGRLDPPHREAIVLRYYLDLSVDQIAARTGANPGTVKSRLHYALRELRAAVETDERGRAER